MALDRADQRALTTLGAQVRVVNGALGDEIRVVGTGGADVLPVVGTAEAEEVRVVSSGTDVVVSLLPSTVGWPPRPHRARDPRRYPRSIPRRPLASQTEGLG